MASKKQYQKLDSDEVERFNLENLALVSNFFNKRLPGKPIEVEINFKDGIVVNSSMDKYVNEIKSEVKDGNILNTITFRTRSLNKKSHRFMHFQVHLWHDQGARIESYISAEGLAEDVDWARVSQQSALKLIERLRSLHIISAEDKKNESFDEDLGGSNMKGSGSISASGTSKVYAGGLDISASSTSSKRDGISQKIIWKLIVPLIVTVLGGVILWRIGIGG